MCKECEEIAAEYREAIVVFWSYADEETRAACRATANIVSDGETSLSKLRPFTASEFGRPANPFQARIVAAIQRKCAHQQKTGHHVSFRTR